MNETRRGFIGVLLSLLGFAAHKASKPEEKRVFKWYADGNEWREIAWDSMRPGDDVITIGIFDGKLDCLDNMTIASIPKDDGLGTVEIRGESLDLLELISGPDGRILSTRASNHSPSFS